MDLFPGTLLKCARLPLLDVSGNIDSLDLRVETLTLSPCFLPEVIGDVHLRGAALLFCFCGFIVTIG